MEDRENNTIGCIYMHRNMINGKVYIGQTINNPEYRWNHGNGYKESSLFYNAIQKYGWDNFEHIILENYSNKDLNERETYWIKHYHSTDRNKGYNLTDGGYGPLSPEQKEERGRKLQKWREANPEKSQNSIKGMQKYWQEHPDQKKEILKKATEKSCLILEGTL